MSQEYNEQVEELLDQAGDLGHTPAAVAVCEQAVALADSHNDLPLGFAAREALIEAATFAGRPDVAIVAFSWCLAQSDRNPEEFPESGLLWQYKWIVDNVADFPNIGITQIEELFADMAVRFQRNGSTLHAVHQIRRDIAFEMYDHELARREHELFRKARRDFLSNCDACVQNASISYHLALGNDEAAIDASRPIIEGGMSCGEIPELTYGQLVLPLLRLGKVKRAVRMYKTGYPLIRKNPKFVRSKANYLAFLTLTNNLDRAARLFNRHLGEALTSPSHLNRYEFLATSKLFLDQVIATSAPVMIRLPNDVPHSLGDDPTPTAIRDWLVPQLMELAQQFDARNGNDGFTKRVGWWYNQAAECGCEHPISD